MEYEIEPYIVYVKVDDAGRITAINSDVFLADTTDWVQIDSGFGDRYHHAQGNYLDKPIMDERGIYRYKLAGSKPVERNAEEMDADWVEPEETQSDRERIEALEEQNAMLTECLLEMSEMLYA